MHRRAIDRRHFLTIAAAGTGAALLGVEFWRSQFALAGLAAGTGPYGALQGADVNGIQLPAGFTSRVLARSSQAVPGTSYIWHAAPDGGACFPTGAGGWIYVSNSELPANAGGASALRFDTAGAIVSGYSILSGTSVNCAGGPTPLGKWLSCEENGANGKVYECDPTGASAAIVRPALGSFSHEAAAVHPATGQVYLTEDNPQGRLYRFTPTIAGDLSGGTLEAARVENNQVSWIGTGIVGPDRQATTTAFNGGEGAWIHQDVLFFTTKGDNRVWQLVLASGALSVLYDAGTTPSAPLTGVDNVTAHQATGDLYVCEDGGNMEMCMIGTVDGVATVAPFLRVTGQPGSELTGVAFSPDGSRMYFSSQRGTTGASSGGITYEVRGPFRSTVTPPTTTTTTTTTMATPPPTTTPGRIRRRPRLPPRPRPQQRPLPR